MATSLAAQLAQVAASSKSSLNIKAQKAAHSKSLIWEPRVASTQTYQTLYATCYQGFEELCQLDSRFASFQSTLFSEESQTQDRTQLTAAENEELDHRIEAFLRLAGSRLRLMPAIKAIEWLIRRFQIHTENTTVLLMTFMPYHSITAFATLLSILPPKIPSRFQFLSPYIRSLTAPPRSVFVRNAVHHPDFLSAFSEYTLESCRKQYQYPALVTFWGGLMTEAVSGILDRTKSGRAAIQSENSQALLHRLGPILAESLVMKKVPSIQIASYMAMTVFVAKGDLEDAAVTALMQQTVHGWTNETVRPGLVCLTILAQYRSAKQMSSKVTKALMKVPDIGSLLVEIGQERRVDKIANGLCLALIERLAKKSDARGLSTIVSILSSQILREKQISVIFKSLLVTAHTLDDGNDKDGVLRRELGSTLISLSQVPGTSGDVIQSVIDEVKFDIEELEMKLDLSFRTRKLPEASNTNDQVTTSNTLEKPTEDLQVVIAQLASRPDSIPSSLAAKGGELLEELHRVFFSITSHESKSVDLHSQFEEIPLLKRSSSLSDSTYCSFFIRIWCGPYPALARVAALDMVKTMLKANEGKKTDIQMLLPYTIAALSDPSKRVRQAAADLVTVSASSYSLSKISTLPLAWEATAFYGSSGQQDPVVLDTDVTAKLLHLQILPSIEECVMDPGHIHSILKSAIETGKFLITPEPSVDKKDHFSQSARLSILNFFSFHSIATPLVLVKDRLLRSLNEVRGVSTTTRTQLLLPIFKWWATLTAEDLTEVCRSEQLDQASLESRFVDIFIPNDVSGLEYLFGLLKEEDSERPSLIQAVFARLKKMWSLMKEEVKFMAAEQFLEISQGTEQTTESITPGEAADLLRSVSLTTDILSFFLDSIHTGTKMITEPPPNKRRRTSSSDGNRSLITQVSPELSRALRKVTFVLQLVDSSNPGSHPELLNGLFTALAELQHFRTVVGSELGYLQNLILSSLLTMMPVYKSNKNLKIDSSGGYGDLLVNCIQKSSSPVVQNSALLLVANLATIAPNLVLHSVMPIFTFMGTTVLRQSDDYSAHVVAQTIREVIPPLVESLKQTQKSPIAGVSDILVSFTTAYEHIPSHRRRDLFIALVETLGPKEVLFALIGMLVDRYELTDSLLHFSLDLLNHFNIEVQLETLVKLLDLIADLFKPKPGMSTILLGLADEEEDKDVEKIALRQLTVFPSLLSNKKLKSQISKLADRDDMETAEVRQLYATLLENVLLLADTVKSSKSLHGKCGSVLSNLLNLLSISEFIKAVESLLDRPNMDLRQKVLRALEVRVESESNTDPASRTALLTFLPQLTAAIRESHDIRYKHTAVTCVDKIAEKYGKKDIEAVVAAASTIAGPHCLGQGEKRLRIMALLCLTSLVDVLEDAVVPILPLAIPQAVRYLAVGLEESDEELHSASYGFIASLAEHLPYMLSTYVDEILKISNQSAQANLEDETNDSRINCLEFFAKKLDATELLSSLDRNWELALSAGFLALKQYLTVCGMLIERLYTSAMTKNIKLLTGILLKGFDLRFQLHVKGAESLVSLEEISVLETLMNDNALKMIYRLNDVAFRPVFIRIMEWSSAPPPKGDKTCQALRQYSVYGFLDHFFDKLKSIVTNYSTYVVEDAVKILSGCNPTVDEEKQLWSRVLKTLAKCFENDQDDFWQAPSHFGAIAPVLMEQYLHAGSIDVAEDLIAATVELAAAADSQAHQKDLNAGLMKHLRSEQAAVRLAAVKCEQALTDRLGEEWLSMLHEMLPRISELQEDDDEIVERETHRWIVKIEGVLGESLDSMLQ